jgi:putative Holliday junction resolvase
VGPPAVRLAQVRILAVDHGSRNIGLAVCDELGISVRPLATLRDLSPPKAVAEIARLVAELGAEQVVAGMPLRTDRSKGDAAVRVERFLELLRSALAVPVATVDETLTSVEAEQRLAELGVPPRERRHRSDEMAACVILEQYLEQCIHGAWQRFEDDADG